MIKIGFFGAKFDTEIQKEVYEKVIYILELLDI